MVVGIEAKFFAEFVIAENTFAGNGLRVDFIAQAIRAALPRAKLGARVRTPPPARSPAVQTPQM